MNKSRSKKVSDGNTPETLQPQPKPPQAADQEIAYCRIHPGVGVARIGNSPDDYYLGPESPGHPPNPPGGFKDPLGRIKRQAARFRIYAYNQQGQAIKELTSEDATITWTVELANKKPSYEMFLGEYWDMQYPQFNHVHPLRNQEISDPEERKRLLEIRPGPRSIVGPNATKVVFDKGTFGPLPYTVVTEENKTCLAGIRSGFINKPYSQNADPPLPPPGCAWPNGNQLLEPVAQSPQVEVPLGELQTDAQGRLLVLGGQGNSGSIIPDNEIGFLNADSYYANNDYWYDDTSDGPVFAEVVLHNGRKVEVKDKAWVLVAPPKYAVSQQTLTTLYEVAVDAVTPFDPKQRTSFTRDIYPVLRRLADYQWVNSQAARQHGSGRVYDPLSPDRLALLRNPDQKNPDAANARAHLFSRLRTPYQFLPDQDKYKTLEALFNSPAANKLANYTFMPQMAGDGGEPSPFDPQQPNPPGGVYTSWLTLSPNQYRHFERWAKGDFVDDEPLPPPPLLDQLPIAARPAALDKASLEFCVGGAFYPGIEITYIARDANTWSGLCRINQSLEPGDITRHMALPWQADFSECKDHWWPAQRPDDVVPVSEYETFLQTYDPALDHELAQVLQYSQPWARGIRTESPGLDNDMVYAWKEFGFIVPKTADNQTVYVETERSPYALLSIRDYFYILMNIDNYPDFLPKCRELVEGFLAQARRNMDIAGLENDDRFSFFEYTPETFTARLNQIYNDYVTDNSSASNFEGLIMETRDDAIFSLLQMAPFNLLDGAWIRYAAPNGPVNEIESLLFNIYMDEMGDGNVEQQHCNVYDATLRSLDIYLPDLHTRDFADDPRFLDSAFVEPVFLLAISQLSSEYFPEILGMTMYLEWGSIGLIASVEQLKAFGIDPQYYTLHVGIDNAASGHGALAKRAIEQYLDLVRASAGEEAMREIWLRIWTGYVAFGSLGTLGADIAAATAQRQEANLPSSLATQMEEMITRKAPYASLNHRNKALGGTFINDWFLDPPGFLTALREAGIIIPGQPDISPITHLMSFDGPMYHVFTEDEQKLWRDYILSLTAPAPPPLLGPVAAMRQTIDYLRQRQQRSSGHNAQLSGPNPDPKSKGELVTHPIHWWFDLNLDPSIPDADLALMKALATESNGWVVKGNAAASPLVRVMLAGNNDMAEAFGYIAPQTGEKTYKEVMVEWIDLGCPFEDPPIVPVQTPRRFAAAMGFLSATETRPRRRIWGMGKVH